MSIKPAIMALAAIGSFAFLGSLVIREGSVQAEKAPGHSVKAAMTHKGAGEKNGAAPAAKGIKLLGAYARASLGNLKNSAAFLSVINHNAQADRLVGAKSTVAARTELHTHIKQGNIMKMRRIEAINVPASGFVDLEPGGHHVMLIGLHKPLKAGDKFSLVLVFEKGGEQAVEVVVRGLGDKGGHRGSHEGSDMRGSHEGETSPQKSGTKAMERGSH